MTRYELQTALRAFKSQKLTSIDLHSLTPELAKEYERITTELGQPTETSVYNCISEYGATVWVEEGSRAFAQIDSMTERSNRLVKAVCCRLPQ